MPASARRLLGALLVVVATATTSASAGATTASSKHAKPACVPAKAKRTAKKPKRCPKRVARKKTAKKAPRDSRPGSAREATSTGRPPASRPASAHAPAGSGSAATVSVSVTTTTTVSVPSPVSPAPAITSPVAPSPVSPAPATTAPPPLTDDAGAPPLSSAWEPLGEPGNGGRISSMSVSPYDPQRVLAGGDMLGVGLSTDAGQHWISTTGFKAWEIADFTWDPVDDGVVWVGTMSGPYRSTDRGMTWTSMRDGMPTGDYPYSAPIQKVLVDATNPDHLVAVGGNQREWKPAGNTGALNYGAVYRSTDGGRSWTRIGTVGADVNVLDVVAATPDLTTLYAASRTLGVSKSTDGGATWETVDDGLPRAAVRGLAIDPDVPTTLWAALPRSDSATNGAYQPGGIYKTTDGGTTWAAANAGLPQITSASASQSTSMFSVYRALDGSLYTADQGFASQQRYVSRDGGRSWRSIGGKVAGFYQAESTPYVWGATRDGTTIYGGTSDAMIASRDRGVTWSDVGARRTTDGGWRGTGFGGLLGYRIAFAPDRPGLMLLTGTDGGNVLRTTTSGASWSRPVASWDNFGGGYDVATGGTQGTMAYAVLGQGGVFNGLAASSDAGGSWSVKAGGSLPTRGSTGANRGSIAVASADGRTAYAVLPDGTLWRTADGGDAWTRVGAFADAWAVAVSKDFATVYVATDRGVLSGSGTSFTALADSPAWLRRLVTGQDGSLYATGVVAGPNDRGGVWRLMGGSWARLATDRFAADVAVDPFDARRVVYVTNDPPYRDSSRATGVWVSTDGGTTFGQRNVGLAMSRVLSVAFDPSVRGRLVIGTDGNGFWQTKLT